jgi:PAS domain S-box-containing protein
MPEPLGPTIRHDSELLELFFSQSLTGAFFMMLDTPIAWNDPAADREAMLDVIFRTQRVTRINDAMLAQYGATREQFVGRTPADFFVHDLAAGRAAWAACFDAGQARFETDERRLDGSLIRIEGEYICMYTPDGRITGHFGVQRDVTERYLADAALRASETRFSAAFRLAPFRLTINRLDDGRFLEVNDAFLVDLRRTRDEVIGRTSVELGLWADPSMREHYIERLRREGTIVELEFAGYERDGRREITQLNSTLIELHGVPCVLTIAHDVTDRRIAEEKLERSERQLRALAARQQQTREQERRVIAREIHDELGQVLTGVKFDVAWSHHHLPDSAPAVRDRLSGALQRIAEAMNAVRRIATELRPAVLDDLGLIAALEWQTTQFAASTGVRITTTFPPTDPPLDSEGCTAVFRIVQEALTNVARHAGASAVHVALRATESQVRVVVRDDGRGITPSEQSNPHALGLVGLRERALAIGGTITIAGTPTRGTEVLLVLPLPRLSS